METEGDIKGLAIPTDIHLTKLASRQEVMEALKTGSIGNVFKLLIKLIKGKTITRKTDIKDGSGTITEQEGYNEQTDPKTEIKQLLNDVLGGKIFLTVGPEEHDKGSAFFSTMNSYEEILLKEDAGTEREQKVARSYKR
ncbi:3817_t:CDS:1 [Funneliformis geosporum]|nr:3817_t:CDS:1 [Funneliformis geosporum]